MKIVKKKRDPPLFTSKQLIKFYKILRNTTQVIVWHRICLQTDGRTDGRTWWNQYTPLQLCCGGYNNWALKVISIGNTMHICNLPLKIYAKFLVIIIILVFFVSMLLCHVTQDCLKKTKSCNLLKIVLRKQSHVTY